ncbi:MAG TPA: acyl-CoA dehydrogenase family protein, partial [Terrimesophilobacter sp.]|nr:acyl-CoA dehydrogenase family protein [Terrimesophilobacter sp.]
TAAEPVAKGFRLTGTKIFTTLSPAWTRLGVHARDDSNRERPLLVFGFLDRDTPGLSVVEDWDALGMRATHSNSTRLQGALLAADRVVRRV